MKGNHEANVIKFESSCIINLDYLLLGSADLFEHDVFLPSDQQVAAAPNHFLSPQVSPESVPLVQGGFIFVFVVVHHPEIC